MGNYWLIIYLVCVVVCIGYESMKYTINDKVNFKNDVWFILMAPLTVLAMFGALMCGVICALRFKIESYKLGNN